MLASGLTGAGATTLARIANICQKAFVSRAHSKALQIRTKSAHCFKSTQHLLQIVHEHRTLSEVTKTISGCLLWRFGPLPVHSRLKALVSPQHYYYHDCSGRIPGPTTRAPPVGFELETNVFQFSAIANLDKTSVTGAAGVYTAAAASWPRPVAAEPGRSRRREHDCWESQGLARGSESGDQS